MIMTKTVEQYKTIFNNAIKYEKYQINDTNTAKNVRCYQAVIDRLDHLNPATVFTVETARGKSNRPFEMPNIGSLMECVLKMVLDKEPCNTYAKEFADDQADTTIGWCDYEIKACMGAVSLNTKIVGDKPVLFVNTKGVFSIRKSEIDYYTKNGKLPYNKEVGKKWLGLTRKLGL